MSLIRLQRYLSMAGVASRRHAEELILQGQVRVGNRLVRELGTKVDPERDTITVQGRLVSPEDKVYGLLYKPEGVVSTLADPEGRTTIADLLEDVRERVFPVGRLEWSTAGALLFTNDGDWAQAITHPERPIPKTYHLKLSGQVTSLILAKLATSISGRRASLAEVLMLRGTGKHSWVEVTTTAPLTRLTQKAEAAEHRVLKVVQVAVGGVSIEGLRNGSWRDLTRAEIQALSKLAR